MRHLDNRQPFPLLVYGVAIAIRLTDVSRGLAVYLVNYFGRALHGPQPISKRVSEGVNDTDVIFDSTNNDTDVIVT